MNKDKVSLKKEHLSHNFQSSDLIYSRFSGTAKALAFYLKQLCMAEKTRGKKLKRDSGFMQVACT